MDKRNIYQSVLNVISNFGDNSLCGLVEDMQLISDNQDVSRRSGIYESFSKLMSEPSLDDEDYGYDIALRFFDILKNEYVELFDHVLDKKAYLNEAKLVEANVDYMIIYWTLTMYQGLYSKNSMFKGMDKMLKPLDDKGDASPFYQDFIYGYMNKSVPYKNGYSYTASWLFGINQVTQTVMTRIGESYWNCIYKHFDLFMNFNKKNPLIMNFFQTRQTYQKGSEIKEYLPLFVSFGYRISFNYSNNLYTIYFPFGGMEMEDIEFYKNGELIKKFDFLDDIFKEEIFEGKKLLDIFDDCENILIEA